MFWDSFEKHGKVRGGQKRVTGPSVSVNVKNGQISMNTAAYELLGKPQRVALMRNGQAIGLIPGSEEDYAVSVAKGSTAVITCNCFVKSLEARFNLGRFVPTFIENGLLITLTSPTGTD